MHSDHHYLEVKINIQIENQDMLISEMSDLYFDGFEQYDSYLLAYVQANRLSDAKREDFKKLITAQLVPCAFVAERIIEPQNWNSEWEKTIEPMTVGEFFIRPTWKPVPTPTGCYLLKIDPKMAFGTGYHETTRLMLRMLSKCIKPGINVLDVGTGTGVLAIAAIKLGAKYAFGFDIDEWSYVNATENALLNEVSDQFEIKEGSFETIPLVTHFDIILANVNRNMLLSTSNQIVNPLKSGDVLVLSGLLDVDEEAILECKDYASLKFIDRLQENEWISLRFEA